MNTKPVTDDEIEAACGVLFGGVFSEKSMDDMRRALEAFAASRTPLAQPAPAQPAAQLCALGYATLCGTCSPEGACINAQLEQPAAPVAPIPALPITLPSAHDWLEQSFSSGDDEQWKAGWDAARNRLVMLQRQSTQPVTPPVAQAEPTERQYVSPVQNVADLVNNLLILDQTLPIYGAQYIDHPTRGRCAIAVDPTVSRERVLDSRWIGKGDTLNAAVIWTRAAQPTESKDADSRDGEQAEGGAA